MNNKTFDYKFSYGDPGMFLELYVPTTYEAEVRRVLELGADIKVVRKYLDDNKTEIKQLLAENKELTDRYDEARTALEPILKGFSIYRGDGAFFDNSEICSEPVSVVRLMFTPPLKIWFGEVRLKDARFFARRFLRFWTHDEVRYLEHRDKCPTSEPREKLESEVIKKLGDWLDQIALLVNGYIVHQLCRESLRRHKAKVSRKPEDEIWVGSFRTLAVNKVSYIGDKRKA